VKAEAGPQGGDAWVVEFAGGIAEMDRDIVLEIDMAREAEPQVQVAAGPDDARYLALTFVPEFDEGELGEPRPSETVFLLDCSGSMQGESIDQATRALGLCLRSLNAGDMFNVCRFGSRYELLSKRCSAYSAATLADALRFIERGADLGGTEIFEPLSKILSQTPSVGGVRNVVVLTDGQVTNEPTVIELARKWKTTNRIFSFGIGSAASGYLVRNLAGATGGAAEFITAGERIEEKVLRTFSRIGSPQVSDVAVRWGDADLQMSAEIPPVFDGDVLRVFARAPGKLPETASLECDTPQGRKRWSVAVPARAVVDGGVIARSWARAMIQSLENADDPASTTRTRRESSVSRRLVSISKQFGILCSRTSLIAVEHRTVDERNAGQPELRRVPVQLAKGWGDIAGLPLRRTIASGGYCSPAAAPAPSNTGRFRKAIRSIAPEGLFKAMEMRERDPPAAMCSRAAPQPADTLLQILAAQAAEGWFEAAALDVLAGSGRDVTTLKTDIAARLHDRLQGVDGGEQWRIVTTAVVLAALRRWFGDRESTWRRAARKARHLVSQATKLDMAEVERLLFADPATPAAGSL
jgi:Ca-activated chloride channel homolog